MPRRSKTSRSNKSDQRKRNILPHHHYHILHVVVAYNSYSASVLWVSPSPLHLYETELIIFTPLKWLPVARLETSNLWLNVPISEKKYTQSYQRLKLRRGCGDDAMHSLLKRHFAFVKMPTVLNVMAMIAQMTYFGNCFSGGF